MKVPADIIIGLASLFLSIPGFLLLFYSDHIAVGILAIIISVVLGIIWYWLNKQPFTILMIEKTLIIYDVNGKKANLCRKQNTRANHKGLTEFWCRNISADGSISNICINNEKPVETRVEAGDLQVCARFKKPKHAGDKFNLVISYDLENAFQQQTESLIHVVSMETKNLKMRVEFPKDRLPKTATATLRFGGDTYKELPAPEIFGNTVIMEIKKPRLGAEYCLEWEW